MPLHLLVVCFGVWLLVNTALSMDCSTTTATTFVESVGSRWLADLLSESRLTTAKQCHTACALDAQCAAYVYWPNGNCQLFATAPEAGYLLAQDKDATYYQKVCLPSTNKTTCGRSFERFAQMVLVGIAEKVLEPVSLEQCLAACTDSGLCKSVMFFHKGKHCVINSEDKTTQPHLFSPVAIDDTIADYYERRCDGSWSDWGAWSECSDGQQIRFRLCLRGLLRCNGESDGTRTCTLSSIAPNGLPLPQHIDVNAIQIGQPNTVQKTDSSVNQPYTNDQCTDYIVLGFASFADCLRQSFKATRTRLRFLRGRI